MSVNRSVPGLVPLHAPLPLRLTPTAVSESFVSMPSGTTGVPLAPHPGAFGVVRAHHVHEGVDLYCEPGTPVFAMRTGRVVARFPFTGPAAASPWWLDTEAVLVEDDLEVLAYGEIAPQVRVGDVVGAGQCLGHVVRVLRNDKGRPTAMLHLERHAPGARACPAWGVGEPSPASLRDPTPLLLALLED